MTRAAAFLLPLLTVAVLTAAAPTERVLVALRAGATDAAAQVAAADATLVDAHLRLWETDATVAHAVGDAALIVQPVRSYAPTALSGVGVDPLSGNEWWRAAIAVDGLDPPGPGVPITIVDSGVDFAHPEFAGRPDFTALNEQEPAPLGGEHGTNVASVIGAPENGAGIVGVYPRAIIRSWDAAKGSGRRLDTIEIVGGILAAARLGPGVINLSLGGDRDLVIELAVEEATARGTLIVAASGNMGDVADVALGYPAVLPRVLTVGSVDRDDDVSSFSSRSRYVDVAAPGAGIFVASALTKDWLAVSGTSVAAPLVSGAAAWIWTVRPELDASQLAEVLRLSARDVGPPGRDVETGFGVINVRAALALAAPPRDAQEPNDDAEYVDPDGDRYYTDAPPLTAPGRPFGTVSATTDRWEDPRDLYRVWIPARRTLTLTAVASTDVNLALFPTEALTVVGKPALADRLAFGRHRGASERLVFANPAAKGRWAHIVVTLPQGSQRASYTLEARTAR
ncbi:MAG: hypothetical protein EXQ77_00370 [Thermoleophilia bacterium]|nr:hypothetical protein [Thermoleophilia bacterium]